MATRLIENNLLLLVNFDIPTDAQLPCGVALWKSNVPAGSHFRLPKVNDFIRSCFAIRDGFKLWDQTLHTSVSSILQLSL